LTPLEAAAPVSQNYKRYVLFIMASVFTMNYADRYLFSVMLQSIKEDLLLTDTQLGFLSGIAFAIFYITLGIPIARWADRGNRVTIASLAMALWGVMVMLCGAVTGFVQLALVRVGAAVGEAGCMPPTYSLVGDYFPGRERARALSIYALGGPMSGLVGLTLGGWLNQRFGWRIAFMLAAVPGLLIAALVELSIVEPRAAPAVRTGAGKSPMPIGRVFVTLWRKTSFRHLTLSMMLLAIVAIGFMPWYAAFMIRTHGMTSGEVGIWLGVIFSVCGLIGTYGGGHLAARYLEGREDLQLRYGAVGVALIFPCTAVFLLAPDKYVSLAAFMPVIFLFHIFIGPLYALMQRLVTDEMRATSIALALMISNLVGMGLGPQMVGILSDRWAPSRGADSLKLAMLVVSTAVLWSAWHFWRASRTIRGDLSAMEHSADDTAAVRDQLLAADTLG
jgi:MFS family permease